jgi:hypothetical protein
MLKVGRDADLAQEPLHPQDGTQFRLEQLEGDVPVMAEVARQVHGRHPAGADQALDPVAIRQRGLQVSERVHWPSKVLAGRRLASKRGRGCVSGATGTAGQQSASVLPFAQP